MALKSTKFKVLFHPVFLIITMFMLSMALETEGQISKRKKRKMRKSNQRISNFSGNRSALNNSRRYATIGLSVNALSYFGDLAPNNSFASTEFSFTRPGLGISLQQLMTPYVTARVNFKYGRIRGDDFAAEPGKSGGRYTRNLHFRNDIKELSLEGMLELMPNVRPVNRRLGFNAYIFGGVAFFHHNPKAKVPETNPRNPGGSTPPSAGQWVSLQPLGTEGQYASGYEASPYSNFQIAIPFGAGIKLRLTKQLDMQGEIGLRYIFTDYLDDVSHNYPAQSDLDTELARIMADRSMEEMHAPSGKQREQEYVRDAPFEAGRVRGSPESNDNYSMLTIRVNYIFGTFF